MNYRLDRPALSFLAFFLVLFTAILAVEGYALHLGQKAVSSLNQDNAFERERVDRLEDQIRALRLNRTKINALFARLSDAVANPNTKENTRVSTSAQTRGLSETSGPTVLRALAESGIVLEPDRIPIGEASLVYRAGCSRLELHRLIPLLAEQENANPFLFLDRLQLSRPAAVPAFSAVPTYLESRFSIRLLSAK